MSAIINMYFPRYLRWDRLNAERASQSSHLHFGEVHLTASQAPVYFAAHSALSLETHGGRRIRVQYHRPFCTVAAASGSSNRNAQGTDNTHVPILTQPTHRYPSRELCVSFIVLVFGCSGHGSSRQACSRTLYTWIMVLFLSGLFIRDLTCVLGARYQYPRSFSRRTS